MKKTGLVAVLAAGAIMFSGCTSGTAKKVAMEIGDETVTLGEINVLAESLVNYGYSFDQAKTAMAEQIESTLKYGEVGKAMEIELEEEAIKQAKQMTAQYAQSAGGLKAYKKFLAKCGTDVEFLNNLFTASAYQTEVMEKIQEEIGDAEPSDDELKQYFEENYYRAKHILIEKEAPAEDTSDDEAADDAAEDTEEAEATEAATEEPTETPLYGEDSANELLERAKNGEDFDAMIEKYSTDPGSAANPDGYVFTAGDMVSEFEEAVKGIEPGEFTVCESDYGYHIIERLSLSKDDEKFSQWFEDNKDAVKSAYQQKQIDDKLNAYCEQYGITITVHDDVIDSFTEDKAIAAPTAAPSGDSNQ